MGVCAAARRHLFSFVEPVFGLYRMMMQPPPLSHSIFGDVPGARGPMPFGLASWTKILQGIERDIASTAMLTRLEYRRTNGDEQYGFLLLEIVWPITRATALVKVDQYISREETVQTIKTADVGEGGTIHSRVIARPTGYKLGVDAVDGDIVASLSFAGVSSPPTVLWFSYLLSAAETECQAQDIRRAGLACHLYQSFRAPSAGLRQAIDDELQKQLAEFDSDADAALKKVVLGDFASCVKYGVETRAHEVPQEEKECAQTDNKTVQSILPKVLVRAAIQLKQDEIQLEMQKELETLRRQIAQVNAAQARMGEPPPSLPA